MPKEVKAYECSDCGDLYKTKKSAESCCKKSGKTYGDPCVELH